MRINQFIARTSSLSRRAADTAIEAGQVTINGRVATLGDQVKSTDDVRLSNQSLKIQATSTYLILHKPVGYVSSRARQGSDPTIYELLPDKYHNLRPAGRLDRDSSGLMLLSDDGGFIQRYTHPSFGKLKTYELTLAKPLSPTDSQQLTTGVMLDDGPSQVQIQSQTGPNVTVSLTEGRNRQLRRTFGALGYTVKALHRTSIGPFKLGRLPSGSWQEIKP